MLNIYIELRYHRQLSRICPDVVDRFFSQASALAKKGGGSIILSSGAMLCAFDQEHVGCAFSVSLAIRGLRELLNENRARVREYFVLVERSDRPLASDDLPVLSSAYQSVVTLDAAICVADNAVAFMSPYATMTALPSTGLSLYESPLEPPAIPADDGPSPLTVYDPSPRGPISALLDAIISSGTVEHPEFLNEEGKATLDEATHAIATYNLSRYSSDHSDFLLAACYDSIELSIRSRYPEGSLPVPVVTRGEIPAALAAAISSLSAVLSVRDGETSNEDPIDVYSLPVELRELAWLVARAAQYLNADEYRPFFAFLGKNDDFVSEAAAWLHSFGALANARDFRSYNHRMIASLSAALGPRRAALDGMLARFLWSAYEDGRLEPAFPLFDTLVAFGFPVPDDFLVRCLYHEPDALSSLGRVRESFANGAIAEAVEKIEVAWNDYGVGEIDVASASTRSVLGTFQGARILAGEYRVLSLTAFLSLARGNGDDAVVYFEYALQNAVAMRDWRSELRTRFDLAIAHFILGDFNASACAFESVDRIVERRYAKDWEVLVLFMKGRIAFELGDYGNAELFFQTAASLVSVHRIPESISLCRVWYARALAFQGRYAPSSEILASCVSSIPEAAAFLIELCLLSGRPGDEYRFPRSIAPFPGDSVSGYADISLKSSGFSVAEDLCRGKRPESNFAGRMYAALEAYLSARNGNPSEMADRVREIGDMAKKAAALNDPYAGVYYYFAYELTASSSASSIDSDSYLSRAFKYLQKRANKIGDNNMREHYMHAPLWNARLYRAAQDNMLI